MICNAQCKTRVLTRQLQARCMHSYDMASSTFLVGSVVDRRCPWFGCSRALVTSHFSHKKYVYSRWSGANSGIWQRSSVWCIANESEFRAEGVLVPAEPYVCHWKNSPLHCGLGSAPCRVLKRVSFTLERTDLHQIEPLEFAIRSTTLALGNKWNQLNEVVNA